MTEAVSRARYSLVYKLNLRLVLRLIGIFLYIDIIICLFTAVSTLVYVELTAANTAEMLIITDYPTGNERSMLSSAGITVGEFDGYSKGIIIPNRIKRFFPKSTADAKRNIELIKSDSKLAFDRLESLNYVIYITKGGTIYKISVSLRLFMNIFKAAMTALMVIQLLTLFSRAFKDARLIRKTLDPITEFTRIAQRLNRASGSLDPDKMEALAGKLEGINASRLDTRIQIEETQDELKNLARAINGMLDRINESYRAQVRFVSDASHELRTPISVIQGYVNLLDRWGKHDVKTLQESITAIKDEATNMKDLIEQLLFLARGDNNTISLQMEIFDLAELAAEVINEMHMIDPAHSFEPKLSEAETLADRALIKQALRILVDNAIKYTDAGGHITVKTEKEGGLTRLSVQDDGIGIKPEIVPHIFDRFYRADESRARATGGAGLGLSIAKWIASRHSGHMEVLSREGLGTRITIVLPAAETKEENEQEHFEST